MVRMKCAVRAFAFSSSRSAESLLTVLGWGPVYSVPVRTQAAMMPYKIKTRPMSIAVARMQPAADATLTKRVRLAEIVETVYAPILSAKLGIVTTM